MTPSHLKYADALAAGLEADHWMTDATVVRELLAERADAMKLLGEFVADAVLRDEFGGQSDAPMMARARELLAKASPDVPGMSEAERQRRLKELGWPVAERGGT